MTIAHSVLPPVYVERTLLKDQAAGLLREMIVGGKIASGTKVTERDVAEWLKISRMPARDALMALERQGLIVARPGGRFVIELSEQDIRHLYRLRITLEKLAVELAVGNATPANQEALDAKLAQMTQAIAVEDISTYSASDIEMHELIWQQAGNPYLLEMLNSMVGPIFMFIASQARRKSTSVMIEDWQESLRLHQQLVEMIRAKDVDGAVQSIAAHIQRSFELSLSVFQQ